MILNNKDINELWASLGERVIALGLMQASEGFNLKDQTEWTEEAQLVEAAMAALRVKTEKYLATKIDC